MVPAGRPAALPSSYPVVTKVTRRGARRRASYWLVLVVDAANVIGARPDGWWRDRAGAARLLLARLAPLAPVVVVLEGAFRAAAPAHSQVGPAAGVEVVLAPGSGDDALVAAVGKLVTCEPEVTVVTADRELARRVRLLGAAVVGPGWLYRQLLPD